MLSNRLCVSDEFVLHHGSLPDTGLHAHGALILLLASAVPLRIGREDGSELSCTSALIDVGVTHRLISCAEPFTSLHIEGHSALAGYLRQHYLQECLVVTDVISHGRRQRLANRRPGLGDMAALFPRSRDHRFVLDPRIRRSLALVETPLSMRDIAMRSCLSESRFSHLFAQEMGVPFRHYRMWRMARQFVRTLPANQTLTTHAHETGFSDAAHLSNSFQKLIGLSPRVIMGNYQSIERY